VALTGRFGFDPVAQPATPAMRLAFPNDGPWSVNAVPHHPSVSGATLDVVASSASAACLSRAEMQIGNATPIPLTATQFDTRHVALRASLAGVPPGPAQIRLYEDDPRAGRAFETAVALAIAPPPAQVDTKSAAAALGDTFVRLVGSGFEYIGGLLVNGVNYAKETSATATSACFDGPPFHHPGIVIGQKVTAQLVAAGNAPGQVFQLTVEAPRPALAQASIAEPSSTPYLSTTPLIVTLASADGTLPHQIAVRVRQTTNTDPTPCTASLPDPTALTIPDADVHVRSATTVAVDFRAAVLHDRAFGTLEMQLVDAATGLGGNWVPLPGTFVRAPSVAQIDCPTGAPAMCRLYGTDLATIDAVKDASGTYVAPGLDCPSTAKGVACVYVPHVAHYTLRLIDGATVETLPDGLISNVSS
jgi:hypothetical protein